MTLRDIMKRNEYYFALKHKKIIITPYLVAYSYRILFHFFFFVLTGNFAFLAKIHEILSRHFIDINV